MPQRNALDAPEHGSDARRRSKGARACQAVVRGITLCLALWLGVVVYRSLGTAIHGRALWTEMQLLWQARDTEQVFAPDTLRRVRVAAGYLQRDLAGLERWAGPPLCWAGKVFPRQALFLQARAACDGLVVGSGFAGSIARALSALEQASVSGPDRSVVLQAVLDSMAHDREQLEALLPAAARLRANASATEAWPETARLWSRLAPGAVNAMLLAPELFGGDRPATFLVVLQNSDELRPTGGFIGSVMVAVVQKGELLSLQFLNSYDVEPPGAQLPPAPGPLARYMAAPGLVFRDANWSPDFTTSAAVLAALYSGSRGPADLIAALDPRLLELVLDAVGPVPVPRYGLTLTSENLIQVSERYWENPLEGAPLSGRAGDLQGWLEHRKDFGGDFVDAARVHLQGQPLKVWLEVAEALLTGIEERHLQLWSLSSSQAQADLTRAGWAGALRAVAGDFMMVVDANLGFNKVDRRIERKITYQLTLGSEVPAATVSLSYRNTSTARMDRCIHEAQVRDTYEELTQQCYWNYVRVLIPRGARLLQVRGTEYPVDQGVEGGRASVGTLLVVPPGDTVTLVLELQLADDVVQCDTRHCTYAVTVQKQAGTLATPLRVQTDIAISSASVSGYDALSGPLNVIETDLRQDRQIELRWERARP